MPGEWRRMVLEPNLTNYGPEVIVDDEGDICHVFDGREDWKRNADLLCASPRLLDGLIELLAVDDALAAFLIDAEPKELGEAEWKRQHHELHDRRRAAHATAREAITKAGRLWAEEV